MNKTKAVGVQSNDLRETNRLSILKLLQKKVASRAELSSELGLSKPAVSSIVVELIEQGLVIEIGHGESKDTGGKRPILLSLNEHAGLFISIYFNSEWYEIALMNLGQNIVAYRKHNCEVNPDFKQTFASIVKDVQSLLEETRLRGFDQPVLSCGVVLKGTVHADQGVMSYSATMPQWRDIPLAAYLEDLLKVPVFIENDARANTLVELSEINIQHDGTLVYVSVGSGIGTGVVLNDQIYRGKQGGAVNFAHTALVHDGPQCSCGNRGCWESVASVKAFTAELRRRDEQLAALSLDEILALYRSGHQIVQDVLQHYTAYWIGMGLANIMNVFNPETIIIQSEMNQVGDEFRNYIEDIAKQRALPFAKHTKIIYSSVHEYLQVKSAFAVMMQYFFSKEYHKRFGFR